MTIEGKTPDKEFFESMPRSTLIRNLCIEALSAAQSMISSDGQDKQAEAELVEANRHLAELGVVPNMHTITATDPEIVTREQAKLKADPILASEWVAGQVRELVIESRAMKSTNVLSVQLSEHDELVGEVPGLAMVRGNRLSVIRDIAMVGMLSSMIDYDAAH